MIASARKLGYDQIEGEARLALGEAEENTDTSTQPFPVRNASGGGARACSRVPFSQGTAAGNDRPAFNVSRFRSDSIRIKCRKNPSGFRGAELFERERADDADLSLWER